MINNPWNNTSCNGSSLQLRVNQCIFIYARESVPGIEKSFLSPSRLFLRGFCPCVLLPCILLLRAPLSPLCPRTARRCILQRNHMKEEGDAGRLWSDEPDGTGEKEGRYGGRSVRSENHRRANDSRNPAEGFRKVSLAQREQ